MIRRSISFVWAVSFLAEGCGWVRPVTVTPPPAPTAFVSEFNGPPSRAESDSLPPPGPGSATSTTSASSPSERPWWTAFADPALDSAIQEALRNNYFLRDVRTLIYENQLDPAVPRGWLWPLQVGVLPSTPAGVQRARVPSAPIPSLGADGFANNYSQANLSVSASYQIDVWGQLDARRRVADDLVEQQRQSTEIAAQNVAEQVTQLWFDILVERALKDLLDRQVRYNRDLLGIVKARFDQNLVPRLVVLQQEQQLLETEAQVPLVVAQLALLNSRLTALLGRLPTLDTDLVPRDLRPPDLPPAPAVGAPADLIEKTPELRFARVRVAETEHLVNQNLSGWLPTIEVLGSAGVVSYEFSQTFGAYFGGVRLTWPIFDGGRRITEAKQLELTLRRRNWQYELALNTSIQRVQEALIQEQKQAESLRSLRAQVDLGRLVLAEARQLFEQGLADYLPVVTALADLSAIERAALQAHRLLLSHRVQLYRALGGTWSSAVTELIN